MPKPLKISFLFSLLFLVSSFCYASTGVKEWMVPNADYGNYFVKATDNEIIVGYVKTEQNVDKLVILADKKGTHSLSVMYQICWFKYN